MCEAELWDDAEAQLRRMRPDRRLPQHHLAEYQARIYLGRSQYDRVLKMGDVKNARERRVMLPMVRAYLQVRQKDRAHTLATQAVGEEDPGAGLAMGEVHEASGRLHKALWWCEWESYRITSYCNVEPLRAAARLLMRLGDYGEARVVLEDSVRRSRFLHSQDVELLVECLRRLGRDRLAGRIEAVLARRAAST